MRAFLCVAVAALCCGCRHPTPTRLVEVAERRQLDDELVARARASATRECKRPLLWGAPVAGRADDELLALVAPRKDQPLYGCVTALKNAPPPDAGPSSRSGDFSDELIAQCKDLAQALEHAIAHEDACSPYLAGRRGVDDLMTLVREARVVRHLAERQRATGDAPASAKLGLAFMRLLHDVRRGEETPVTVAMVSVAAMQVLLDGGRKPFIDFVALRPSDQTALEKELVALESTDPPFRDALSGEDQLLLVWARQAKGRSWIPPGGLGIDDEHDELPITAPEGMDPTDTPYIGWMAQRDLGTRMVKACPPSANATACAKAILGVGQAPSTAVTTPIGKLTEPLIAVTAKRYAQYVAPFWLDRFALRAMRLHGWVIAHRDDEGRCPSAEKITNEAGALRLDPANNEPFDLQVDASFVTVKPSAKLASPEFADYQATSYKIDCGRARP